jgi:hypothetical protein
VLPAAALAIRARSTRPTEASVTKARTGDRSIVLTWAMRGTLHLVTSEDHRRFVPLLNEPHVARSRRRLNQEGVTGEQSERAVRVVTRMLEREGPLTRSDIAAHLRRRGVATEGQAIAHLVWLASSDGSVCFGPDRAGKRTHVLSRDWIGPPNQVDRDRALADLAVRYLRSHSPATPDDLTVWSGLRRSDAKRAWAAVADRLVEVPTSAGPMWCLRPGVRAGCRMPVRLLPAFDEYLLGWDDRDFAVAADQWRRINAGSGWLNPVVVEDGRVVATWKIERNARSGHIEVRPFGSTSTGFRKAASSEAEDVERFLKIELQVRFSQLQGNELRVRQ